MNGCFRFQVHIYIYTYPHIYVQSMKVCNIFQLIPSTYVGSFHHFEDMNAAFVIADANERVVAKQKEIFALFLGLHFFL